MGELGIESAAPDRFAARVMNLIFGGSFNSRLNINLRTEHGWSYGAFSFFEEHRQAGPFISESGVMADHTAEALSETFRELRRMQQGEVTDAELSDAKESLLHTIPARFTSGESVAELFARAFAHGLPPDYFATYSQQVSAVSKEDVARAARERLHPDRAAIVVVGPLAETRKALGSLGLGAVEVRDAQRDGRPTRARRETQTLGVVTRVWMWISEVSVRWTGHRSAISPRRLRCSSLSGPPTMTSRSIRSSLPSLVSQVTQSLAWILSCERRTSTVSSGHPLLRA